MRTYLTVLSFLVLIVSSDDAIAQRTFASLYTKLSGSACSKSIDDKVTGAYTFECPGIRKYRLQVLRDDERSSINVVTPEKRVLPLDYWDVVTRGFSTLGKNAEWRVAKFGQEIIPVAVIVRINTLDQSDPERPKRIPLLAIAKISQNSACVTQIIVANAPNANEQARRLADNEHLPCIPRESDSKPPRKG